MKIYTGIVLKLYSSSDMTILDKEIGKITTRVNIRTAHLHASNGAILLYTLKKRGSSYTIDIVDLEYIPFNFARNDIFFLHHILELCYYFLPMGCAMSDVFDFLVFLFSQQEQQLQTKKHILIARLCYMFGFYPDDDNFPHCMDIIMNCQLEQLLEIHIDAIPQKWLNQWVWSCIMTHPFREKFKTVGLLKRTNFYDR